MDQDNKQATKMPTTATSVVTTATTKTLDGGSPKTPMIGIAKSTRLKPVEVDESATGQIPLVHASAIFSSSSSRVSNISNAGFFLWHLVPKPGGDSAMWDFRHDVS